MARNLIDFQRNFKGFDQEFDKETGGDRGRQRETEGGSREIEGDRERQRETLQANTAKKQKNRKYFIFYVFLFLFFIIFNFIYLFLLSFFYVF